MSTDRALTRAEAARRQQEDQADGMRTPPEVPAAGDVDMDGAVLGADDHQLGAEGARGGSTQQPRQVSPTSKDTLQEVMKMLLAQQTQAMMTQAQQTKAELVSKMDQQAVKMDRKLDQKMDQQAMKMEQQADASETVRQGVADLVMVVTSTVWRRRQPLTK